MNQVKRLARRIFVLLVGWSFVIAAACFTLLGYALSHDTPPVVDHLSYHLSTYGLVITVTALMRVIPAARRGLRESAWVRRLIDSPLGLLWGLDPSLRTWLGVALTMVWNVLVAAAKLAAGIILKSQWLKTLGIYYLLLAALRMILVTPAARRSNTGTAEDWDRYRACGGALLAMTVVLLWMVIEILLQRGGFHYPGPLIYLMAAYAFWAMINCTVKLARYHRGDDPLLSASRAVSLTAAMVSMLALETAMIERFGEDPTFHRNMVAITGAAVCLAELIMAVYMLRRGRRMLANAGK